MCTNRLNFTAVIGEDLKHNIFEFNDNIGIFYGEDMFLFDSDLFKNGKSSGIFFNDYMMNLTKEYPKNNLYLFLLKDYSMKEIYGLETYHKLAKMLLLDYKLFLVTTDDKLRISDYIIKSSGFMIRTEFGTCIFNIFTIIGNYVFLITIIMKDFISKVITTTIMNAMKEIIPKDVFFRLPSEDCFIHLPWKYYHSDSLKTLMNDIFIDRLKHDNDMNTTFNNLENKNLIINIRVISSLNDL